MIIIFQRSSAANTTKNELKKKESTNLHKNCLNALVIIINTDCFTLILKQKCWKFIYFYIFVRNKICNPFYNTLYGEYDPIKNSKTCFCLCFDYYNIMLNSLVYLLWLLLNFKDFLALIYDEFRICCYITSLNRTTKNMNRYTNIQRIRTNDLLHFITILIQIKDHAAWVILWTQ